MPDPIKADLFSKGTMVRETSDLGEVINNVDVLYMTRIQRERFPDLWSTRRLPAATGSRLSS